MKIRLLTGLSIVLLFWAKTAGAACSTYGGRATVVQANGLGIIPVVLSDTGYLDSTGGAKEASLPNASVLGLLSGEVAHATAIGEGNSSQSEASVANLNLTVSGNTIGADFVMARANASCDGGAPVSGSTEIGALVINGQSIFVTGSPNQTLSLPGGGLIILNEQTGSVQNQNGSITVNALHVTVPGVADAVIASAFAGVTASLFRPLIGGGGGGAGCDFVTGGGWITTPYNAKGTFGVAGGKRPGWGHLEYIDHGTGMNVHGTTVTSYISTTGTTSAEISGTAEINGQSGFTYIVDVADNGEPGRNDTFFISLSNGYAAGGTLGAVTPGGGNIQCHNHSSLLPVGDPARAESPDPRLSAGNLRRKPADFPV